MGVKTFHHYTNAFGRYATHNRFDTFSYQNVDIIDENRIQFIVYNWDNIRWSVRISPDAYNINPNYTFRQLFCDALKTRWYLFRSNQNCDFVFLFRFVFDFHIASLMIFSDFPPLKHKNKTEIRTHKAAHRFRLWHILYLHSILYIPCPQHSNSYERDIHTDNGHTHTHPRAERNL